MDDREIRRRYAQVFDAVADDYDRVRPTYPDELIDAACRLGGLAAGDHVVEVGCGTGKLTAALLARGLRVHAIDPGANMIRVARSRLGDTAPVTFEHGKFEDAAVAEASFAALFSATAFHWVDPATGWAQAAAALRPGGMLALIQYCGVAEEGSAAVEAALEARLAEVAPDLAASLPPPRDAAALLAGASERRGNVSELWSWIGRRDMAAPEAADLFEDAQLTTVPTVTELTGENAIAQLRTTSLYARIAPDRRAELEAGTLRVAEQFGGVLRWSELAVLVTASRRS
jgi:ubiquinone/menaquinone biosynthesis C-methylase UbiE